MSVVLPAPLGPMRQRSSPFSRVSVTSVSALNPSKLTDRFSTHSASERARSLGDGEVGDRRRTIVWWVLHGNHGERAHVGGGAGWPTAAAVATTSLGTVVLVFSFGTVLAFARATSLALMRALDPDQAVGQEQRHRHEQRAQHVEPGRRERCREPALAAVDQPGARARRRTAWPRPPTATQIAISIEFDGCISLGLMIPTCGT